MTATDTSAQSLPRFCGVATFMRTPWVKTHAEFDIGIAGVPFDGGVTARPGARFGPREIRNMSTMTRAIHHVTGLNPFAACRVVDVGDVPFTNLYDLEKAHDEIRQFLQPYFANGKKMLMVGGDHSITYPIFQAMQPAVSLGMVHIDAHTDTWDAFAGSKFTHGSPFRRAVEAGLLDPRRTVQIGIRGAQNSDSGWRFSHESGMRVIFIEEFEQLGVDAVIAEARRVVGDGPTYLSIDVDGLDPVFAPGTGTPEIGGLTTRETLKLIRGLSGLDLRGADVVEVSPPYDLSGNTALLGATLLYEALCLLAESYR